MVRSCFGRLRCLSVWLFFYLVYLYNLQANNLHPENSKTFLARQAEILRMTHDQKVERGLETEEVRWITEFLSRVLLKKDKQILNLSVCSSDWLSCFVFNWGNIFYYRSLGPNMISSCRLGCEQSNSTQNHHFNIKQNIISKSFTVWDIRYPLYILTSNNYVNLII